MSSVSFHVYSQVNGNVVTVTAFIDSLGNPDDGIEAALSQLPSPNAVLYFPAGTYYLRRPITIDSTLFPSGSLTITGDGSSTILDISSKTTYTTLASTYNLGDSLMYLSSVAGWNVGDGITAGADFLFGTIQAIYPDLNAVKLYRSSRRIPENVNIPLAGSYATGAVPIFYVTIGSQLHRDSLIVRNITLHGSKYSYPNQVNVSLIEHKSQQLFLLSGRVPNYDEFSKVLFQSVTFTASSSEGLLAESHHVYINGCTFIDNLGDGIHISGPSKIWTITNNSMTWCGQAGVYFCESGDTVLIQNNLFQSCLRGVNGIGNTDVYDTIRYNTFKNIFSEGILVSCGNHNIAIDSNQFIGSTPVGNTRAVVIGSLQEPNPLLTYPKHYDIQGNTIQQYGKGIEIDEVANSIVQGNAIIACDTGIVLSAIAGYSYALGNAYVSLQYPDSISIIHNTITQNGVGIASHNAGFVDSTNIFYRNYVQSNGTNYFLTIPGHSNPIFTTTPDTTAKEDSAYVSSFQAVDPNHPATDSISYCVVTRPSWLTVDTVHHSVNGIPRGQNVGDTIVVVEANDNSIGQTLQKYTLHVAHTNHPPQILSTPVFTASEDSMYKYQVFAHDQDSLLFGDRLSYTLTVNPSWLTINGGSGLVSGIPRGRNVGDSTVTIMVSDGHGGTITQSYPLIVTHTNHPPVVKTTSLPSAIEDSLYQTRVYASDQDSALFGDVVHYRLLKPAWLVVDSTAGIISGTPHVQNVFDTTVVLQAYDNHGDTVQQQYVVHITQVDHTPTIASSPVLTAHEDTLYQYQVVAHDPDTLIGHVLTYTLTQNPSWLSMSAGNMISGIPRGVNVGDSVVTILVSDGHGGTATQSYPLTVTHTNHAPVIKTTSLSSQ